MSLSHKDDYYETPDWIINVIKIDTGLDFKVDGCASYNNKKFPIYIPDDKYGGALNDEIPENQWDFYDGPKFINPPRSKNGKFVTKVIRLWNDTGHDYVMMLCWNDLGNNYGEKLIPHIIDGSIKVGNLGKIKFNKNGIESEFVSRLTYFWAWFKSK